MSSTLLKRSSVWFLFNSSFTQTDIFLLKVQFLAYQHNTLVCPIQWWDQSYGEQCTFPWCLIPFWGAEVAQWWHGGSAPGACFTPKYISSIPQVVPGPVQPYSDESWLNLELKPALGHVSSHRLSYQPCLCGKVVICQFLSWWHFFPFFN